LEDYTGEFNDNHFGGIGDNHQSEIVRIDEEEASIIFRKQIDMAHL
jgi:hypothetical protein